MRDGETAQDLGTALLVAGITLEAALHSHSCHCVISDVFTSKEAICYHDRSWPMNRIVLALISSPPVVDKQPQHIPANGMQ